MLLELREEIEELKAMLRLCHDSKGFAGIAAFEHGARLVVKSAKQNEGWLRSQSSQVQGRGQNRSADGRTARASTCAHGPRRVV
ncbi:MAG: hypothetical protein ABR587_03560 [Candidatus Binatia bacterium]